MKKILIGLLGIISLGLINFSSAGTYTYNGTFNYTKTSTSSVVRTDLFYINVPLDNIYNSSVSNYLSGVSCTFSNISFPSTLNYKTFIVYYYYGTNSSNTLTNNVSTNLTYNGNGTYNFTLPNINGNVLLLKFAVSFDSANSSGTYSIDYSCTISGNGIIDNSSSDCSTVEGQLTTCQSSLLTCQSDLTTCQNSSSSCSPEGSCTVNDKLSDNLLYTGSVSLNNSSYTNIFNYGTNGAGTYCVKLSSSSPQTLTFGFTNSSTGTPTNLYQLYNDQYGNWVCLYGNKSYFNAKLNSSSNTVSYEVYKLTDLLSDNIPCSQGTGSSCDYSDYILISDVTKNYCTNRYSDLIDEEDITSGYCETEFGLIDPINCPASGGTGDVNWSTFWVNNTQIQGASSIYLYLPDFLNWDYTYINTGSTLQIDVENEGDQEYINNILDIQSYHPDKDQFAMSFAGFLTLLMPYIIITLFIIFVWKLIRRIFR